MITKYHETHYVKYEEDISFVGEDNSCHTFREYIDDRNPKDSSLDVQINLHRPQGEEVITEFVVVVMDPTTYAELFS